MYRLTVNNYFFAFVQDFVDGPNLLIKCCKYLETYYILYKNFFIFTLTNCFKWFSLLYPGNTLFMNSFRECYEAYVIYSFMRFLFNYLHENYNDLDETISEKPQIPHFFPFWFLKEWKMGK